MADTWVFTLVRHPMATFLSLAPALYIVISSFFFSFLQNTYEPSFYNFCPLRQLQHSMPMHDYLLCNSFFLDPCLCFNQPFFLNTTICHQSFNANYSLTAHRGDNYASPNFTTNYASTAYETHSSAAFWLGTISETPSSQLDNVLWRKTN